MTLLSAWGMTSVAASSPSLHSPETKSISKAEEEVPLSGWETLPSQSEQEESSQSILCLCFLYTNIFEWLLIIYWNSGWLSTVRMKKVDCMQKHYCIRNFDSTLGRFLILKIFSLDLIPDCNWKAVTLFFFFFYIAFISGYCHGNIDLFQHICILGKSLT